MRPRPFLPLLPAFVALAIACAAAPALAQSQDEAPQENLLIKVLREEGLAYENGEGVEKDPAKAVQSYCKAARLGDADSQYNLGWMYANGRGVERSDSLAAFFFQAAAEQGMEAAIRMLQTVGGPTTQVPDCLHEPAQAPALVAAIDRKLAPVDFERIAPPNIAALVKQIAPQYKVSTQLAFAIIQAESNFNTAALSPKNAKGLMQLIPDTAARFNVRNPYDAAQNIRGGIAYLRWLLAYFEGDITLVAAAYNAGEGTVERYGGIPPYVETRNYVRKILRSVGTVMHPFDASATGPSPKLRALRAPRER